ncbi:MAG: crotonase/enoyl-CoA hydratase family protein [Phototrophicaceae bacterium]
MVTALSTYETYLVDIDNKIAHVRLNRPHKANSLAQQGWDELEAIFTMLDQRSDVRVIVLSGEGKNFCAGIDLEMFAGMAQQFDTKDEGRKREAMRDNVHRLQAPVNAIENCRKPVLAAIHRACVGGAVDIITACDMRYCTDDTFFSIEEINIGMVADLGTLQRLPRLIGEGITRELAYTGRRMLADEAYQRQLVNHVYADKDTMMAHVMQMASEIATKSPLSIRGTKQVLNYSRDHSVADGLEYIAVWNAGMLISDDITEAMTAKLTGRNPQFED